MKDIEQGLEYEELTGVVIVGHSFGGRILTGVVDRKPELIERTIFLDSALPEAGKSLLDQMPKTARDAPHGDRRSERRASVFLRPKRSPSAFSFQKIKPGSTVA